MEEQQDVALQTLPDDSYFEMPWRDAEVRYGHLRYTSSSSAQVRIPRTDASVFDDISISPGTMVLPATKEAFLAQRYGGEDAPTRERSDVESPVKVVWRICNEMVGAERKAVLAKCIEEGVNPNTAKTQYYHWKKQNG